MALVGEWKEVNKLLATSRSLLGFKSSSNLLSVDFDLLKITHDGSSVLFPHVAANPALVEEFTASGKLVSYRGVHLLNLVS